MTNSVAASIYTQAKCRLFSALLALMAIILLSGCNVQAATPAISGEPLTIYGWDGYMPQSILDAFTAESGIAVRYVGYGVPDEAMDSMRSGEVYDLVVLDNLYTAVAIEEKLLAPLDYRDLPNFANISSSFRDLAFDPKNKYSVPFQWGTIGLLYRTDLVDQPVTGWADLWNPVYAGKVALWPYDRDVVGMTLKTLGYSGNSQNPEELAEASARLMALKGKTFLSDTNTASSVGYLLNGEAEIIVGWPYDIHQAAGYAVEYVLPREGTFIWLDNLVIPAGSSRRDQAQAFLNFLMRPEIGAMVANEMYVAVPNEASLQYIDPEILNNPLIFPAREDLAHAEFYQPLSPETAQRYQEIWLSFSQ